MNSTATPTYHPIVMPGVQTRMNEEEEKVLLKVLREAGTLATGPEAEAFEKEFAAFTGAGDAVCVSSCSSALEMSAKITGLKEGDEVILPAHTYTATAVPFARTGATLRWADIHPRTRLVTAETIEPLITDASKVIVVVHLYGLSADMDPIVELARKHGLQVVEDCAQAPGARYKGERVGAIGDFGCFSFHTHKNMCTLGEGGMLAVRNPEHGDLARRIRWMGNWPWEGERDKYWIPAMCNLVEPAPGILPVNFCMGEPNCAVGRLMLRRLDLINAQRQKQAERFQENLRDCTGLEFQDVPNGCEHVYHLMAPRVNESECGVTRDDLLGLLAEKYKLTCLVQYWPLNRAELYRNIGFGEASVPHTDDYFDHMISFPWWSDMEERVLDDMADRVQCALSELRS